MAESKKKSLNFVNDDDEMLLNLTDIVGLCISNWFLFALCLIITLSSAYLFLRITPPVYTRTTSIAIKVDANSQAVDNLFVDFKVTRKGASISLKNEIIALQQVALMAKVVDRLKLDYEYTIDKRVLNYLAYGSTLPVSVEIQHTDSIEAPAAQFTLHYVSDDQVEIYNDELWGKNTRFIGSYDQPIKTPVGMVVVHKDADFRSFHVNDVSVRHMTRMAAAYEFKQKLDVFNSDKESSVLSLSLTDINIQRADDVLNTLIAVYNEEWIVNRNQVIVSTNRFIGERLKALEEELDEVEEEMTNYLIANHTLDIASEGSRYMGRSNQYEQQNMGIENEKALSQFFRDYIAGVTDNSLSIPLSAGISNPALSSQVDQYNTLVLERNNLLSSSVESNPLVSDKDKQLVVLRNGILLTIDNHLHSLETQLNLLRGNEATNNALIDEAPSKRKIYTEIERRYRIKEQLYTYLLRTREQNELQQAFDAYNTRVLQPSTGSNRQSYPNRQRIWLIALGIGFGLPLAFIVIRELANSKVRGRKDIEKLTLPFVGELPQIEFNPSRHFSWLYKLYLKLLRKHTESADEVQTRGKGKNQVHVAVKEGNRNIVNEAFRVMRTNAEFLLRQGTDSKVIMITSANPHSGKTFISYNLAFCIALQGKKVCAIDLDLRRRSLSKYVPKTRRGVSDYLNGTDDDWRSMMLTSPDSEHLHILPVGTLPPNPAELLSSERFGQLVSQLRAEYDIIFFDCPPVEIVADTAILSNHVDVTLFIIRVGMMELEFLPVLENYYREQKFPNMGVILNGTLVANSRYGYRRYGYRYGYGYGYGYGGYGYGYSYGNK